MYDCMYVSWNMFVYLIFFILWILLVKPQSGVKATLKNIWSQNAKEPGDACRIPRGAWKLHRCIEHATRWILYRMEPTFYVVVGANFRPQPLALWVSNVWQALSSEESIQICLTRFVTWLIMTDTAFFEMCQKSIDRRRMSCFLHLNLIPSIQRNYAKPIGLVSTKVCWKHKQHDNSRHSAWHSYSVSSFIKLLQWRCKRWKAHSVQATHQNHTMEDLRQATWVASVNSTMHCSCTSLYMLNLFHIKIRRC